jgi:hypothetical protein
MRPLIPLTGNARPFNVFLQTGPASKAIKVKDGGSVNEASSPGVKYTLEATDAIQTDAEIYTLLVNNLETGIASFRFSPC